MVRHIVSLLHPGSASWWPLVATPHGPAAMLIYDDGRGTRPVMLTRRFSN